MKSANKLMSCTSAAVLMIALAGCTTVMGHAIPPDQVASIVPGKTTKSDLQDKLGSPMNIVTRDEIIDLPTPRISGFSGLGTFPGTSYELRTVTFFTLFPESKEDDRKIYYYHNAVSHKYLVPLLIYWGYFGKTQTDRLWVLVNENTGIVENYAYKQYEKDTVFGKSP